MAAERLFSLELLVDWVRLEAVPPPHPAVAFRLLDFPPLLVRAPTTPAPAPGGALGFGRGKACVFRLRPAALRRPRLRAALLQLPAAPGPPAPRMLGACDVPLPAARGPGSRGTFVLLDPEGERVGDLALFCRLTELGDRARDPAPDPVPQNPAPADLDPDLGALDPDLGALDPGPQDPAPQDPDLGAPDPDPQDPADLDPDLGAPDPMARPSRTGSAEISRPGPVEASGSSASASSEEDPELDLETNTFCPPPLYYTHLTQERAVPAGVKITIEPQRDVPEELGDALPQKVLVNPPTHLSPPEGTDSATLETLPVLLSPPGSQDVGAINQTTCHPQTEQNTINTIRQLPLLNALLIELSLLYNQPVASPTHVHPHLAWLYKTEDEKVPESGTKSTCQSESKKDKLSVGGHKKSASLQCKKNQVENLKKGKCLENNGNCQKRVTRGKLLYGLTNTLRLRLKQTNPDMLVIHEKREEYRKMQAQMLGTSTKFRIPSSKVLSFAEQSQKPHQLPRDKYLDSDASSESSDTSRQISEVFDETSTTKETKLKCATGKKTVDCGENRTSTLGRIASPADFIIPERLTHTSILGGKLETRVQSPCVFQQHAMAGRIVDKEIDDWQVRNTDNGIPAEMRENSSHESISELKYSDDFTSPCYSEDFYTTEETSRSLQTHASSPQAEISPRRKSNGPRPPLGKSSSEKSSILSPPFSAGSPILSQKRCHLSKTHDKSVEKASSNSTSNLSSSHWTKEKESQIDQNSRHNTKDKKRCQDFSMKLKAETDCKWSEKSQSLRTSQVSSYLPSNLSELELNVLDGSTSDHFEDDDDIGSLRISKQYKDICELVINKLPGYTV
ncbi:microtubule-associated protein 10 [Marmota flaviventris]|uniref:microtubule-associated protein 10 n=1 Tax=Marmota flaviventris TaxID=93162 RepID=UPI003A898C77